MLGQIWMCIAHMNACLCVLCASLLVPAFVCIFSCVYVCAGFYIPPCIILDDVEFVVLYLHF